MATQADQTLPRPVAGLRPATLLALVFLAGTGSMATEICASRLLAPYYGSSTIVWANIIGLILASLSLGYWLGGRVADRRPQPAPARRARARRGRCLVALIPFVARPFLDVSIREHRHAFDRRRRGLVLRLAAAVRAAGRAAGHGHAVRHPAGGRRCGRSRQRPPAASSPSRRSAASSAPSCRRSSPSRSSARSAPCSARRPCWRWPPPSPSGRRWLPAGVALAAAARPAAGDRQGAAGPHLREGVALPVHPGRAARRRPLPLPQRGLRHPLRLAGRHRAHRRRVGHVPDRAAAARPSRRRALPSWATPAAPPPAPTASSTRRPPSTASRSTRPSRPSRGATSASATTRA